MSQAGQRRYDVIGRQYARNRRPDPRIAATINAALGDASRILDVGAGTGSYEPEGRRVIALEPSVVMIGQRRPGAPPAVRGVAEDLPFSDHCFDAAMAMLTLHHWADLPRAAAELRRVAPRRVVFTFDPLVHNAHWLLRDYVPEAARFEGARCPSLAAQAALVGATDVRVVPVPHDCIDGFGWAYWRRPEMYLDHDVRSSISMLAQLAPEHVQPGIDRLAADLRSGRWHERNRNLLDLEEIDGGYRLLVANDVNP